ncbi:aldehyde dehydrogenase (NADP(+)) [Ornithinimicrobium murale]|uniref:aldehyde dehydrogenase (NADP(+)) n=1 Tax=Ornithinimicrobium murale TaxID=1050153 RepID=UPI000E0E05D9|nr:aldehyde dehydrogenase (NADP(+)) [Ornithinimicrobium murale]
MAEVESVDARTGNVRALVGVETSPQQVDAICLLAHEAFRKLHKRDRSWRAKLIRGMADSLAARREDIVAIADAETGLGADRIDGELTRTCFQLRMFAGVVEEGSFVEAIIDHSGDTAMGPRPDLRRMLVPIGPVAVFGASNFPLAFSVPGGDTAAALAAGCTVVVKAHESHPDTSRLCHAAMQEAAERLGAPKGTIGIVYGRPAGSQLVQHPSVSAVGFTGSVQGGRALMALIEQRTQPIPFYGELGSVNPLVVSEGAAAERAEEIGRGLASSVTLGAGQFCTKPGVAFVPSGADGDRVVSAAAEVIESQPGTVMLNAGITKSFAQGVNTLIRQHVVRRVASGQMDGVAEDIPVAQLLEVHLDELTEGMVEECFGPIAIVVRYDGGAHLLAAIDKLPHSLTATLHTAADLTDVDESLRVALESRCGRLVYNGFPTGVAVSWAQNHGGGWPASNSLHTSVGATAVRRFQRPLAWQNAPQEVLPVELRDETTDIIRRIDGTLQVPAVIAQLAQPDPREGT